MSQATPELRARWGIGDGPASKHLLDRGFQLRTETWTWIVPPGYVPDEADESALEFLFQEWDYCGEWGRA